MITWFDMPAEGLSPGSQAIIPTGKITITKNGTDIDVAQYAKADVNVEGGGGSSDFTTAEVTVVNNSGYEFTASGVVYCADANELGEGSPATIFYSIFSINDGESKTLKVPLYKGMCTWDSSTFTDATASGDITIDWAIFITGNGTITISNEQ